MITSLPGFGTLSVTIIATNIAILVADVSNSIGLYETLGDEPAHALIAGHQAKLTQIVKHHGGVVFMGIGDSLLCSFPTADHAAQAAIAMHQASAEAKLSIHIGFHFGPAQIEGSNVFGTAVNIAGQIAKLTEPGQSWTSGSTVDALPADMRACTRSIAQASLKGESQPIELFAIRDR